MNLFLKAKRKYLRHKFGVIKKTSDYIHNTQFGFKIILDFSKDVDRDFFLLQFEYDYLLKYKKILKPGNIVIDVGANIGIYSLLAGKEVGALGKVYAFEPAEWANSRLLENIKLNNLQNIEVNKTIVTDTNGSAIFFICDDDAYNSLSPEPMNKVRKRETLKTTSLDSFCKQKQITTVDVLKIDTEGADYLVLKGAKEMLHSENPPVIFCEYNWLVKSGFNFSLRDMEELLYDAGYTLFEIMDSKLLEFDSTTSQSSELVCIPNSKLKKFAKN